MNVYGYQNHRISFRAEVRQADNGGIRLIHNQALWEYNASGSVLHVCVK